MTNGRGEERGTEKKDSKDAIFFAHLQLCLNLPICCCCFAVFLYVFGLEGFVLARSQIPLLVHNDIAWIMYVQFEERKTHINCINLFSVLEFRMCSILLLSEFEEHFRFTVFFFIILAHILCFSFIFFCRDCATLRPCYMHV